MIAMVEAFDSILVHLTFCFSFFWWIWVVLNRYYTQVLGHCRFRPGSSQPSAEAALFGHDLQRGDQEVAGEACCLGEACLGEACRQGGQDSGHLQPVGAFRVGCGCAWKQRLACTCVVDVKICRIRLPWRPLQIFSGVDGFLMYYIMSSKFIIFFQLSDGSQRQHPGAASPQEL